MMDIKKTSVAITLLFLSSVGICQADTSFNRSLTVGSSGSDVLLLQQILNIDSRTQIAATGIGSPNNETSYFGLKTKQAVQKFQQLYANDILKPAGLAAGNGFVGPLTIKKLNAIADNPNFGFDSNNSGNNGSGNEQLADYRVSSVEKINIYSGDDTIKAFVQHLYDKINKAVITNQAPVFSTAEYSPTIPLTIALNSHEGVAGNQLTLRADNLTATNDVYFGPQYIVRNVQSLGGGLAVTVPPLPAGVYDIVVKTTKGYVSNSDYYVVHSPQASEVHITAVNPTDVNFGNTITITGSGFTATDNMIVTDYDKIKGVSSADGRTISFTVAPESLKGSALIGKKNKKVPFSVMVVNANGVSEETLTFNVVI